jgi:hypothetical protein
MSPCENDLKPRDAEKLIERSPKAIERFWSFVDKNGSVVEDASDYARNIGMCEHSLAEKETACADGLCPLCLLAENERQSARANRLKARAEEAEEEIRQLRMRLDWYCKEYSRHVVAPALKGEPYDIYQQGRADGAREALDK